MAKIGAFYNFGMMREVFRMDSFWVALNAVMPFLLYIAFGYGVQHTKLVDEAFLNRLNTMVFKCFFPILMFYNVYKTKSGFQLDTNLVIYALLSLLIVVVLLILIVPRLVKENPARGVVIQAIYRSNFVLFGVALTISVYGEDQASLAAILVSIVVPAYNVIAVIVLEMFRGRKPKPKQLIKNIVTNPLILGALCGLAFYLLGIHLPDALEKTVAQFSNLTTPMALFTLGGTLHFSDMARNAKVLTLGLLTKLILIPAVILGIAAAIGFRGPELFQLLVMYGAPVATASYAMAQNMGGDGKLAGQFVVISTVASVVTIFFWIFSLRNMQLI